jgi:hypothetical protein
MIPPATKSYQLWNSSMVRAPAIKVCNNTKHPVELYSVQRSTYSTENRREECDHFPKWNAVLKTPDDVSDAEVWLP